MLATSLFFLIRKMLRTRVFVDQSPPNLCLFECFYDTTMLFLGGSPFFVYILDLNTGNRKKI